MAPFTLGYATVQSLAQNLTKKAAFLHLINSNLYWILANKFGIDGSDKRVVNMDQTCLWVNGIERSKSWKPSRSDQSLKVEKGL